MNLLDIIGPVMVGPSSSHTAGAVKIGRVCHKLLAEKVVRADIYFHGSFLATGKGHGTDKAVVAGLLGMQVDDPAIPHSFEIAEREGLQFTLSGIDLGDVHPNSVKLELTGESGRTLEVIAASIGGGRIEICEIDGLTANFSGDYPTLIVHNIDQPGHVTEVTSMLAHKSVNIATMQLYRASRGGNAVMVIECDQEIPADLRSEHGVHRLVRISPFNAAGKRQTSFVSCDVMPDIKEDIDIEINPDDIRIDTYRSSGAGGQHINKTSSAIRITHYPTGIVVTCQNERSQFQNKDKAMQMLKAKLYMLRQEEQAAKAAGIRGDVKDNGWGSQIRSYVLQPYTMVKDLRTGEETGNVDAVLDGGLDSFISAYLRWMSLGCPDRNSRSED